MLLSCGVALQHFTVALSALGWATDVHRFPNPRDSNHVAGIDIIGRSASDADIALAAAIPHRRTDRRWVSSWPVPGADVAALAQQAPRAGVMLRRVVGRSGDLSSRVFASPVLEQPAGVEACDDAGGG